MFKYREMDNDGMTVFEYGNPNAGIVLVQPVDDHDMSVMDSEVRYIRELTDQEFGLIAVKVRNWNTDLSPWVAPAAFGNEGFGNGAADTLAEMMKLIKDPCKTIIIGGYSLAGLFALWAAIRTDLFCGVAAASPSVWFPGFIDYMADHSVHAGTVYLSLGDKEEKTRNPVMSKVGECIREGYSCLQRKGVCCTLEWNSGNHFKEPDLRTAKAFAWVMERTGNREDCD